MEALLYKDLNKEQYTRPLPDPIVQTPKTSAGFEMGVRDKHGRDKTTPVLKVDAHQELGKGCPHVFPGCPLMKCSVP